MGTSKSQHTTINQEVYSPAFVLVSGAVFFIKYLKSKISITQNRLDTIN